MFAVYFPVVLVEDDDGVLALLQGQSGGERAGRHACHAFGGCCELAGRRLDRQIVLLSVSNRTNFKSNRLPCVVLYRFPLLFIG